MKKGDLKKEILLQLLYSEVFRHPLDKMEISTFVSESKKSESELLDADLSELVDLGVIHFEKGYYYVFDEGSKIATREKGTRTANKLTAKAYKTARFIHRFPFIEGVCISGSLSKGVLHDEGDFDFFIITEPKRLWAARTFLILYKKIFLFNSRKYFCVNYFIDSDNLEIEEKNRFTATEITTLIPVSGNVSIDFFSNNKWVTQYFPNRKLKQQPLFDTRKATLSKILMYMLKGKLGCWLDKKCMHFTVKRWQKKFHDFDNHKFDLAMKSRRYVSKHHPNDFQNKVLNKHQELIDKLEQNYSSELKKMKIEL